MSEKAEYLQSEESETVTTDSEKSPVDESEQTDRESTETSDIAEETVSETENGESGGSETYDIHDEETEEATEYITENDAEVNESDMETSDSDEIIASGNCGLDEAVDKLTWTLTKDGTFTIFGTGKMKDYSSRYKAPWNQFSSNGRIKKLVIQNGVTNIGDYAFYDCSGLMNLTFPDSLTSIGNSAFSDCSLTSLTFPNSLTSIGDSAFSGCGGLTNLTFPDDLTSIGGSAFSYCSGLTNLTFPDSLTSIGNSAFSYCSLTSLTFPNSLTSIGDYAFYFCDLTGSLTFPDGLTSIGDHAFYYCNALTGSLIFPDSLISIGDYAFGNCWRLNGKLYIPESVTFIGSDAFLGIGGNETIYGVSGSYAETYANEHRIPFVKYTYIKPDSSPISISGKANFYVVDSELATPIEGAKLSSYGSSGETDANGYASIDIPEDISKYYIGVQVTAPGYETHYFYKMPEPDGTYYITMELADDSSGGTSSGNIKLGYARAAINGDYTNILTDKLYLEHTDKDIDSSPDKTTMEIWVKARGSDIDSYSIIQGDKVIATSSDGKFSLPVICEEGKNPLTSLDAQTEVRIKAVSTTNKTVTQKIGLCIGAEGVGYLEDKNSSLEIGTAISVTVPDNIPFLGGMSLKYGLENALPFDLTIEQGGKVKIALNKSTSESIDAFKEDYDQLSSRAKNVRNAAKAFGGTPQTFGAGSVSAKVSVKGYGEGYIDMTKPGTFVIKVGLIVSGSADAKYTQYFFAGAIPFYISVETGVKITGTAELAVESEEWKLQTEGGVGTLSGKIYLAATGGVGVEKAINIHATGTGACNYYFKPIDEYTKVWLSAELELQSEFFGWELNLWKSDPAEYIIYEPDKKTAKGNTHVTANVYDAAAYSIMDRSYQSKGSDTGISSYSSRKSADRFVAENIYPGARPEMVMANGIYYLFWLQDIPTRSAENRAAVVYAASDDGVTFSSPRQLVGEMENQTFDNGIDLYADDGKIYVCWQDAAESCPSGMNLMDAVQKLHISYAVLDSATGNVLSYQTVTDKEGCYMQPKIYVQDGNVRIAWVHTNMTDSNNLWDADNQEELQIYDAASDKISTLPLGSGKEKMISMDGAVGNGQAGFIYALDMDGDLATVDDRKIYFDTRFESKGTQSALTADTGIYANPVAAGGSYYWYADGNIEYARIGTDTVRQFYDDILSDMNSDFAVISDGNDTELIWNAIDKETEKVSLYGIRLLGEGEWSRPFRIEQTDSEMTGALSGCMDGGVPYIAYQHIVRNEDGSKAYSISAAKKDDIIDVSLDYAEYDYGQFEPSQALPIMADITNKGTVAIKSLEVELDGVSAGSKSVNLDVGETVTLEVNPVLDNITEYSDHVLLVKASGENMLDDNTYKMGIGYTDVKVLCNERQHDGKTWLDISVLNDSPVTSGVTLNIRADKADGEIIYTEDLGSIESGRGISMTASLSAHEDSCCTYFVEAVTDVPDAIEGNNVEFVYTGYGTNVKGGSLVPDPVMYTVSFDSNGGSTVESQQVEVDRSAIEPQSPTREGYHFLGWNMDGKPYNFYTPVTGNITLQAQWEEYETLVSPTATIASGSKVEKGTKVFLTCAATGADIYYTMDGSDPTTSSNRFTEPIVILEDMVIRAFAVMDGYKNSEVVTFTYTIDQLTQYTVTFNTNGGSNVEEQIVNENEPAIEPPVPTKDGYTFSGWYLNGTLYDFNTPVTADITLEADWTETGAVTAPSPSIASGSIVKSGTSLELVSGEGAKIYYTVDGTDPMESSILYTEPIILTEDITIKAFAVKKGLKNSGIRTFTYTIFTGYTVTFNSNGGTLIEPQAVAVNGKAAEPIPPTKEGYTFLGWYLDGVLYDFDTVVTSDTTLEAKWVEEGKAASPTANIASGRKVKPGTKIKLISYENANIYYTLDETIPTRSSTLFVEDITVTKYTIIKAFAVKDGLKDSDVATFIYDISEETEGTGDVLQEDIPESGIPNGLWIAGVSDAAYTGQAIRPTVRVYDYTTRLIEKKDYTISYKNNVNANDAANESKAPSVVVKAKGNYSGKETATFKILAQNINSEGFDVVDIASAPNGKVQKPVPVLTYSGKKLSNKKHFKVEYPDKKSGAYKDKGTYTIKIIGTGNYTGERTINFTITDSNLISKAKISKISQQSYTGKELIPTVEVKYGKNILKAGTDYEIEYRNNIRIGIGSLIIKGKGDYAGQKSVPFKIVGVPINKAVVNGLGTSVYTGDAIMKSCFLSVAANGNQKTLKQGEDYTISFQNNTNAGKATAIFTGINGYSGVLKKTFKIEAYDIGADTNKKLKIDKNLSVPYCKNGSTPDPVIIFGDKQLVSGTDYSLSYKNNKTLSNGGAEIIVKGKGNFKGTVSIPFTITSQKLDNVNLVLADKPYKNKAKNYATSIKLLDTNGRELSTGKDYDKSSITYTYADAVTLERGGNKKAGDSVSATDIIPANTWIQVAVNAKAGSYYTGNVKGIYRIIKSDIKSAKVSIPDQIYTGSAIVLEKSDITVTVGGNKLTASEFEIVSCTNNIKKGKASITIKGIGNYGGTKTVRFTIKSKGFTWWWRK